MNLGIPKLILVCLVIVVLFGPKKIPEIAEGSVRGIQELRKTMKRVQKKIEQAGSEEVSKST